MRRLWLTFLPIGVLFLYGSCAGKSEKTAGDNPKNIIFLIGDGMGLAQISAAIVSNGSFALEFFKIIGLVKTSSSDDYITDSAAGATAFSAGVKTKNGAIGVDDNGIPVQTILELAELKGLSCGLIATSSITHATPASYFAHQPNREMHAEIANDFYGKGIDVVFGGGKPYFDVQRLRQDGYRVITGTKDMAGVKNGKVIGFFNDSIHPPKMSSGRGDFLKRSTNLSLNILSKNSNGFFLMIEGSQIDWGGHDRNLSYVLEEMKDFNQAILAALEFAKKDGNTLVVVTADHETGGLALTKGDLAKNEVSGEFINDHHSGIMVPIFAYGPGANGFSGIMENTDVFFKMKALLIK